MASTRSMFLAGAAGALLASVVAVTVTLVPLRQMTVQLPGGGTEEIRYSGLSPQVAIYPNAVNATLRPAAFDGPHFGPPQGFGPPPGPPPGFGPPRMDPMAMMMEHNIADLESLAPSGAVCIRQIQISSDGGRPVMTSRSFGACAAQPGKMAARDNAHQHI